LCHNKRKHTLHYHYKKDFHAKLPTLAISILMLFYWKAHIFQVTVRRKKQKASLFFEPGPKVFKQCCPGLEEVSDFLVCEHFFFSSWRGFGVSKHPIFSC